MGDESESQEIIDPLLHADIYEEVRWKLYLREFWSECAKF